MNGKDINLKYQFTRDACVDKKLNRTDNQSNQPHRETTILAHSRTNYLHIILCPDQYHET